MVCHRVRWVLNHTVCLEGALARLLVVTLRHVNVFVHVVTHRAARCGAMARCRTFVAFLATVWASLDVLLIRF